MMNKVIYIILFSVAVFNIQGKEPISYRGAGTKSQLAPKGRHIPVQGAALR
jgi:hypothetical protein